MNSMMGTFKNGQIYLDERADWPEGCRVKIEPAESIETFGISEEDWDDTPEGIAEWIEWYKSLEPLKMTAEEQAAWDTALEDQKAHDKSKTEERAKRIEELFE